jgi:hypothetical protein
MTDHAPVKAVIKAIPSRWIPDMSSSAIEARRFAAGHKRPFAADHPTIWPLISPQQQGQHQVELAARKISAHYQ